MMNCEDLRDDLITHAAGEALEPEADARLQQHLKQCAGCRQRFEWERQVQDALEAQEVPSLPGILKHGCLRLPPAQIVGVVVDTGSAIPSLVAP